MKLGAVGLAAFGAAVMTTPSTAADLNYGGSLKDTGYTAPVAGAGPCYVRADVGYAWAPAPDVEWPVKNERFTGDANANGIIDSDEITFIDAGSAVNAVDFNGSWLGEVGAGCGQGSRGWRGEIMFGFRSKQKLTGIPAEYEGTLVGDPVNTPPEDIDDPLNTSIRSLTLMFNLYRDLGRWGPVVPYIGAGIGMAFNEMSEVYFTGNPNLVNRIEGNEETSFAWSVMAGVAYQISPRAILDLGYRYIDLGDIESGTIDDAGFKNPAVEVEDLSAHEIKLGLRYHFGARSSHVALK